MFGLIGVTGLAYITIRHHQSGEFEPTDEEAAWGMLFIILIVLQLLFCALFH